MIRPGYTGGSYERSLNTVAGEVNLGFRSCDAVDGIVTKRSWTGEVRNVSLLVASAANSEGFR
jgi:hypothetical protein